MDNEQDQVTDFDLLDRLDTDQDLAIYNLLANESENK